MMEELKNIKDNKLDKAIKETGEEYSASDWVTGWKKHKKNVGCDNFYTQWYRPKYDQGCRPKNENINMYWMNNLFYIKKEVYE